MNPPASEGGSDTWKFARRLREQTLRMVHAAKASHIGSCLSVADIVAVLYGDVLRVDPDQPDWPDRDRFILSKGHAGAVLFAALAERGFFPESWLDSYCKDGSKLAGHITHHDVPGAEVSSGALGHGLPIACGMALAAKRDGRPGRVFVVLSDGEMDEGTTWEAALLAAQHRLDNLTLIVDYNKIQSFGKTEQILDLDPLADKWRSFRWGVQVVDGHDHAGLLETLRNVPLETGRPSCIVANTVKGKGVSFMEHDNLWHYRPPDATQLSIALRDIGVAP